MKTVVHVVGARPNYMKIAPLIGALRDAPVLRQVLVDTGQHYDWNMARVFFGDLAIPEPDRSLGVGSHSQSTQTARIMMAFEAVCSEERPDLVVVVGDVNSTLAAALVAAKMGVPLAHVEAGLRSFDRTMPEEINRIVTDQLADLLFTPSPDADENLLREGIAASKVHRVGNIMIDTLLQHLGHARFERVQALFPLAPRRYAVLTLHRPSSVDREETLRSVLGAIARIGETMPVVFPVHPRTRKRMAEFGLGASPDRLVLSEPFGYLDFLALVAHARIVLTDSGGLQEETCVLGIPCLTLRENTERPITVATGTNRLVGTDPERILAGFEEAMRAKLEPTAPALWDGHTSERIAAVLRAFLGS